MKNLIQDTIKKIGERRIAPEPKWKFRLRKYGLWIVFAIILIMAALSFDVALNNGKNLDWDLYQFMHQSRATYILSILPYFWIILIGIFLAGAFFEIRKTETGYRFSQSKILLIVIGGLGIFGMIISIFGFGTLLNSKLAKEVPFYSQHMMVTKESQWMQPTKGFLAGTIISASRSGLEIDDLKGKKWNVNIDGETVIKPSANISPQGMIKLIGTKIDEDNFKADEIRPWQGRGIGRGRGDRIMESGGSGSMMRKNEK